MPLEIERKFRVRDDWEIPPAAVGARIRQAYLTDPAAGVEVRVRSIAERYFMTVKKPLGTSSGKALSRHEVEFPIDVEVFDHLWDLTVDRLDKERWTVAVAGHTTVVDVYLGKNEGLRVVEVEFATPAEADAFDAPAWFGPEITGMKEWGNRALAGRITGHCGDARRT
ncbi:CYTH domain-containing protein [Streptomyces sp. NPDC003832]